MNNKITQILENKINWRIKLGEKINLQCKWLCHIIIEFVLMKWHGVYSNPWIIKDYFRMCIAFHLGTTLRAESPSIFLDQTDLGRSKETLLAGYLGTYDPLKYLLMFFPRQTLCWKLRVTFCIMKLRRYVTLDDCGNYVTFHELNVRIKINKNKNSSTTRA